MEELWKVVHDCPNYEVSTLGRIRRLTTRHNAKAGAIRKPTQLATGYYALTLMNAQGRQSRSVHRLVAEAFLPRPEGCTEVNHIDCIRSNNRVDNLQWVTSSANTLYAYEVGTLCALGESNGYSKLTDAKVLDMRQQWDEAGLPISEWSRLVAEDYGVTPGTVRDVIARRSWKHL